MKNQKIIKICEERFIYLNYSYRTRDNYMSHIKHFLESLDGKQIIHCNANDVLGWQDRGQINALMLLIQSKK